MTVADLIRLLQDCPIVASVQASDDSPMDDPQTLLRIARSSIQEGVKVLRLEGATNIRTIKAGTDVPVIGLVKRRYEGSEIYITPTEREVEDLLDVRCEVVALDSTTRRRPGKPLAELIEITHRAGSLAMADCDSPESVGFALDAGADVIGTTLSGYTTSSRYKTGPDLGLVRTALALGTRTVLAEGRYEDPWQVRAALQIGAVGAVIGGALNDPVKQTRRFIRAVASPAENVGAIDLGGTWLRFAIFSPDWKMKESWKIERPDSPQDRLDWIARQVQASGVRRVGVGSGGIINPSTGSVIKAKSIIPGHIGTRFDRESLGAHAIALNDGLASAWGHSCHPRFAGLRVATLSLGTGVGFGIVDRGRLLMGTLGEPPHLNDTPFDGSTIEAHLGGHGPQSGDLGDPPALQREALGAFRYAVDLVRAFYHPDAIVVCGSVGLSQSLLPTIHELKLEPSPFGADAGLYGAAALAIFPPELG